MPRRHGRAQAPRLSRSPRRSARNAPRGRGGRPPGGIDRGRCPRAGPPGESMWVTFSAMTDVAKAPGSLGLVDRVAALHRIQLFAGIPGRVLAAVGEAAIE